MPDDDREAIASGLLFDLSVDSRNVYLQIHPRDEPITTITIPLGIWMLIREFKPNVLLANKTYSEIDEMAKEYRLDCLRKDKSPSLTRDKKDYSLQGVMEVLERQWRKDQRVAMRAEDAYRDQAEGLTLLPYPEYLRAAK